MRNSLLAPSSYLRAPELFVAELGLGGPVPPKWEQWLDIVEKFGLDNTGSVDSWREIAQDVRATGSDSPWELASNRAGAAAQMFSTLKKPADAGNLW